MGIRRYQIYSGDLSGTTSAVDLVTKDGSAATSGYPLLYDMNGNAIARQPRGNTTVVQLADSTTSPTSGNLASFDASANVKDSAIPLTQPFNLTTTGTSGAATLTPGTPAVLNIPQYSGGGGSSVWTQISDQTLGSAASSVTFSSVSGYNHLVLFIVGRNSGANGDDGIICHVNGDTNDAHYIQGYLGSSNSGTFGGVTAGGTANSIIAQLPGTNTTANSAASIEIRFPNYGGTTFWKGAVTSSGYKSGSGSAYQNFERWWEWQNTSAITSIILTMQSGGNFVTGSRFTLYGLT